MPVNLTAVSLNAVGSKEGQGGIWRSWDLNGTYNNIRTALNQASDTESALPFTSRIALVRTVNQATETDTPIAISVGIPAQLYPTTAEVWANAPPFPTTAQVESTTEWEMNPYDGSFQGLVVDVYPRDEGWPDSMSISDACNLVKNSPAQGGMLRVHYGTSGVHKVYNAQHPDVIAGTVTSDFVTWPQSGGHLYVVGIPDAQGNKPSIVGQLGAYAANGAPYLPALFSRSGTRGGDTFFKDITLKSIKSGDAVIATGSRPTVSDSQTGAYLFVPQKKVVLDNVTIDCGGANRAIIFGPEWDAKMTDLTARINGLAEMDNEIWMRNCDFSKATGSHLIYLDRIRKAVIVDSNFYDGAPSAAHHAFKVDAQEIIAIGNNISNCALDGTLTTAETGVGIDGQIHLCAVPVSLVAGQYGYLCNNRIVHYCNGSNPYTGAYSVHQQIRPAMHALEDPMPLEGPQGPRYAASNFFSASWWTNTATNWTLYCYDNQHVKVGPDGRDTPSAIRLYRNAGTWPVRYREAGTQLQQLDNQAHADRDGDQTLVTNTPAVPAEWFERSKVITGGDTVEGLGDTIWAAYNAGDNTIFYQSQTDLIGTETINPTDDDNAVNGTGVGRFTIQSDPTRVV